MITYFFVAIVINIQPTFALKKYQYAETLMNKAF
jgi:hypothetical protein